MPETVLGFGDTSRNKTDQNPCPWGVYIFWRGGKEDK
jgi:hypothetical protein